MKRKVSRKTFIRRVTEIRRRNNILWMGLMDLAMKTQSRKAKRLIRQIVSNDQKISRWMSRI